MGQDMRAGVQTARRRTVGMCGMAEHEERGFSSASRESMENVVPENMN
jgi:hypothetical protein